jgi:hypothetical protein
VNRIIRTLGLAAPVLAVAIAAAALPAKAAGHGYCVGYANSAVSEQSRNLARRCGFFGPRWHGIWTVHYNWCRSVDRSRARQERQLRRARLRACRA